MSSGVGVSGVCECLVVVAVDGACVQLEEAAGEVVLFTRPDGGVICGTN